MCFFKKIFIFLIILSSHSVNAINLDESLSNVFSSISSTASNDVLHPDDAFEISLDVISSDRLVLNWKIEPGYYLYKDKFLIKLNEPSASIGEYVFPSGKLKDDLAFGMVEVYYGENQLLLPFSNDEKKKKELNISIDY